MRPEQKRAWFILGICAVALLGFVVFIIVFKRIRAAPFAICALWVLEPLLFRRKSIAEKVSSDERDQMIAEKAVLFAGAASYVTFILACIIPWIVLYASGAEKLIHVDALGTIIMAGGFAFFVAKSITTLVLYGRERRDGQD
ncbi:MAG: hypothetical protein KAT11_04050 [Phycisphaerae bacterium]|nr:hypothetical protein [Phycisphaerae bacterium]